MMKFRRSAKNTKSQDLKSQSASVPTKHAIAIEPPKKVIRAIYDYQVENPHENIGFLSFTAGDFLHVVGREDDPDWYEASNPMHFTRGLVPVSYFEEVGRKKAGLSDLTPTSRSSGTGGHDSGYSEKTSDVGSMNGAGNMANGHNRMRSSTAKNGAIIYGTVVFNFKAERSDELDASAGENIIVIAQSNPEWFVAKPIGRLGGPGLIPVAFIELRDIVTGKPVVDVQEAVARAGIPTVEEWKKTVAEYKNSSIPLGRLESNQNLSQGLERLSISSSARPSHEKSRHGSTDARARQGSNAFQQQYQPPPSIRASQLISPVRAKVPGYSHHHGEFWFNIEAIMEDGRSWNLERSYKDFYALQLQLIEMFPENAGKVAGSQRNLPHMPGPLPYVTEQLTSQRRAHFDQYTTRLLGLEEKIKTCQPVRQFFYPRPGDSEIALNDQDSGYRQSIGSRHSAAIRDSRHSSVGTASTNIPTSQSPLRQEQLHEQLDPHITGQQLLPTQYRPPTNNHHLAIPNGGSPPPLERNNSALSMASEAPTAASTMMAATPAKVKVWFGEANCVVVRLPPNYTFADLDQKLRERWALERQADRADADAVILTVEYKDEQTQAFYRMDGDEDLMTARMRNDPKLALRVGAELESL